MRGPKSAVVVLLLDPRAAVTSGRYLEAVTPPARIEAARLAGLGTALYRLLS